MLVVGEREEPDGTVSVRRRDGTQVEEAMPVEEFAKRVAEESETRARDLTIE